MRFLHRHPSEVDLTMDQIAEVAYIGQEIDKHQAESGSAIIQALMGSRIM